MTRATSTKPAAPAPQDPQDPAALLMAALQAIAASQPNKRQTSASTSRRETLSQPLTDRDREALVRMGWSKLTTLKPVAPSPRAKIKDAPTINPATFADLSPERQASAQFWAGLTATLARNNGRVWLPEIAAVAYTLEVDIPSPAALTNRLAAMVGRTVSRPAAGPDSGWLVCKGIQEAPASAIFAQLWASHLNRFSAIIAAED